MIRFMLFCTVTLAGICSDVQASQVAYSWSGIISKSNAADPTDPWLIGPSGKPFEISVVVDHAATDMLPTVPNADFNLASLAFSIQGTPATSLSFDNSLDFIGFDDNLFAGLLDQISVTFTAQFNGFPMRLGASVRVPDSTFTFSQPEESPPVFGVAITSQQAGFQVGNSLYAGGTGAGVEVISSLVPEPSSVVLLALGLALMVSVKHHIDRKAKR